MPYTVGIYSPGKAFVVYDMRRHVYSGNQQMSYATQPQNSIRTFPTAPSPVTTHLMSTTVSTIGSWTVARS